MDTLVSVIQLHFLPSRRVINTATSCLVSGRETMAQTEAYIPVMLRLSRVIVTRAVFKHT